jgi:hypothetical protein
MMMKLIFPSRLNLFPVKLPEIPASTWGLLVIGLVAVQALNTMALLSMLRW